VTLAAKPGEHADGDRTESGILTFLMMSSIGLLDGMALDPRMTATVDGSPPGMPPDDSSSGPVIDDVQA
jgi:hypothetical protein